MVDDCKPRLVLRFGVTGHRPPRLSEAGHVAVKVACADLFGQAQRLLSAIHGRHLEAYGPAPPAAKLISSLAEGADVIAAETALEAGMELSACLPFAAQIYAEDFEPGSWLASERLLERAESVLELGEQPGGKEVAYEAAGRLVMSQSDILIAVWDGDPAKGRGGTAQIVAEAIAMHLPVIHIDPANPSAPRMVWPALGDVEGLTPPHEDGKQVEFATQLTTVLTALCEPPHGEERAALGAFLSSPASRVDRAIAWPLLLAVTGARKWRNTRFRVAGAAQSREWLQPKTASFADNGRFGDMLNGALLDRYAQADAQATHFGNRYRSTFVTNYAMSGTAVLLALSSLLLPSLKLVLITLELLVIALILINTQKGVRLNLHQCWLDRRQVAERLRMLVLTAPLGHLGLRTGEDGHQQPGWVQWYVRATARELGMPNARFDDVYLETARSELIASIDEQSSYHRGNAHAMAHADHSLHHWGDIFFFGTVLACLVFIVAYLARGSHVAIAGLGGAELVTFITALFPALAAALYGIRMQGDFAASSRRSAEIDRRLQRLRTRLAQEPLTYQRLLERARGVREILLAEVQQWRSHYESRPLTLPG